MLQFGSINADYLPVFELITSLVKKYITPTTSYVESCPEAVNKVFELMLSLLDVQSIVNELSATSQTVLEWGPIFQSGNPR